MNPKVDSFLDLIILISFLSIVPLACVYSPALTLVYLATVLSTERWLNRRGVKKWNKEREKRFLSLANEFKTSSNLEPIKVALAEAIFQMLFCLYHVLGQEEYNKIDFAALSSPNFKIDSEIAKKLAIFLNLSGANFTEVNEAEFLGNFLHFCAGQEQKRLP